GLAPQLVVDHRQQPVARALVALAPGKEQPGDVGRGRLVAGLRDWLGHGAPGSGERLATDSATIRDVPGGVKKCTDACPPAAARGRTPSASRARSGVFE